MPKIRATDFVKVSSIVKEYGKEFSATPTSKLYCNLCQCIDRRNSFSSIGQPPKPVLTRWETWLSSAMWHSDKLPFIQNFINQMEGNGLVLQRARLHVNDSDLPQQLVKLNLS